jgi:hypothetical protein
MKVPAKQLTLDHVSEFMPRQLFEMIAPSGDTYCLELAIDTFDELEAAIELSRKNPDSPAYPIKNLNTYTDPLPVYSFNGLKELLSSIVRYRPCWTNKW